MIQGFRRTAVWIAVVVMGVISGGCGSREVSGAATSGSLTNLTVNYEENPIGIEDTPVFGWRMQEAAGNQTAYQIFVAESPEQLEQQEYVWDSGRIESGISVAAPYGGGALEAGKQYAWRVCAWDESGNRMQSVDTAFFEMGLTDGDWGGAAWIGIRKDKEKRMASQPYHIAYDVRLGQTHSGFVWGMDTNQYGDYLRFDINTLGESVECAVVECSDTDEDRTAVVLNEAFPDRFASAEAFCGTQHHVELDVRGGVVSASVDGVMVLVAELARFPEGKEAGNIGLWTARGAYYAYYDNIIVTDGDMGTVICEETFDDARNHIFSPYYAKITDGWCEASSGFLLPAGVQEPAPMLRYAFECERDKRISSARLYATALGDYRICLNGKDVCGEYLTPGRSIYSRETYYRTYDVTEFLSETNVIGAVIGHGRYNKSNARWGAHIAFQAKLVVVYEDGSSQTVVTGEDWQAYEDGPVRNDDMFLGEFYDATKEQAGWCSPGYAPDGWKPADVFAEYDGLDKKASEAAPVICVGTVAPVAVSEPVPGEYVYDFGQNFNGNCRIALKNTQGMKGNVITIRYAEAVNDERMSCRDDAVGTIWTQNLYAADNTDYYVVGGIGEEAYTPSLVCRGFRYVQISGLGEPLPLSDVSGLVISTDNRRTGSFVCSDEKVNRLYDSIYWTQVSNYLDVPTDCPQRDERFGWAGDAQVFANTAMYNSDVYNYLKHYTEMLIDGQCENGAFPEIAPSDNMDSGANGWSDAGIILVWELYQQYGNPEIIRENLDAMCRYMDYLVDTSENYVRRQHNYSDHNAVSVLDDEIANTAQCAYVAQLLSKMSADIGENDIAKKYGMVYNQYKKAWQDNYINEDGSIDCWLQSAYTLGLAYGLYPEELAEKGARCLNNAILEYGCHLNTGYVATQFLLPVLCKYGYTDTAYRILQQDTYPSWNHMLSYNQTTITESWYTRYDTDGGTYAVNGSLNHFGLGTVGQWMYSDILGIRRDEDNPGYRHFYIEPQVGGGLTYASGSYESVYGTIESSWRVEGNELVFRFVIPSGTTATVSLPDAQYQGMELGAGTHEYRVVPASYSQ